MQNVLINYILNCFTSFHAFFEILYFYIIIMIQHSLHLRNSWKFVLLGSCFIYIILHNESCFHIMLFLQNRNTHTDTEKRAFPLIGNETSRSIIRNAHSRQYFSRQQMAMRWVAPRLTVGSYTAEKTKNTCGPSERSEFKKSCRTVKSWVESALKLIDILQDCKHKSCSCEWFTHP